jgi:hypothetical protein
LGNITIAVASSNADIIGFASAGGRQDATSINSQSGPLENTINGTTNPSKIYLLRFRTQWFPHASYES